MINIEQFIQICIAFVTSFSHERLQMLLDAFKVRLANHQQIHMAVSVFIDHGFSKDDIHSKITAIFNVDLDQLDDVLYSSEKLGLSDQVNTEDMDAGLSASIGSSIEQFKLMVATKYWSELSEANIQ